MPEEYYGSTFQGGTVQLDGRRFINCVFIEATLVFAAKAPVSLQGCIFTNVKWVLDGPAALTVSFLTALYHGGARELVENAFEAIKRSPAGLPAPPVEQPPGRQAAPEPTEPNQPGR